MGCRRCRSTEWCGRRRSSATRSMWAAASRRRVPPARGTASNVPRANMLAYNIVTGAVDHLVRTEPQRAGAHDHRVAGRVAHLRRRRLHQHRRQPRAAASRRSTPRRMRSYAASRRHRLPRVRHLGRPWHRSTVYVGGNFTNVGSQYRGRLAAFNTSGTLLSWAPDASDARCGPSRCPLTGRRSRSPASSRPSTARPPSVAASPSSTRSPARSCRSRRRRRVATAARRRHHRAVHRRRPALRQRATPSAAPRAARGHLRRRVGRRRRRLGQRLPRRHLLGVRQGDVVYSAGHAHYCGNIGGFMQPAATRGTGTGASPTPRQVAGTVSTERLGYTNFAGQPRPDLLNWFPTINAGTYTGQVQGPWNVTGDGRYVVIRRRVHERQRHGPAGSGAVRRARRPPRTARHRSCSTPPTRSRCSSFERRHRHDLWQGNRDRDDATLRYRVFRRTGATGNGTVVPHAHGHRAVVGPAGDDVHRHRPRPAPGTSTGCRSTTATATSPTPPGRPWPQPPGQGDYLSAVLASEPDSLWRLGESSGATVATDTVGWRDATIPASGSRRARPGPSSATPTPPPRSTVQPRTSKVVSTTQELTLPHVFSLEAWVKTAPSANGGPDHRLQPAPPTTPGQPPRPRPLHGHQRPTALRREPHHPGGDRPEHGLPRQRVAPRRRHARPGRDEDVHRRCPGRPAHRHHQRPDRLHRLRPDRRRSPRRVPRHEHHHRPALRGPDRRTRRSTARPFP